MYLQFTLSITRTVQKKGTKLQIESNCLVLFERRQTIRGSVQKSESNCFVRTESYRKYFLKIYIIYFKYFYYSCIKIDTIHS